MTVRSWMTGVVLAAFLCVLAVAAQSPDKAEIALRAAIEKEKVEGDLKGALEQYKKLAQGSNRAIAAQALIHMGECYEKLGSKEARAQYDLVISKFSDQKDAVAIARARLGTGSSNTLAQRLLCAECADSATGTSIDGRWVAFSDARTGDLAVRDLSTGQVRRLLAKSGSYKDSVAYATDPVFSPDLRQVAYLWNTGEQPLRPQIRVMANEPGGKSRVVLDSNIRDVLGWSADGKSILAILMGQLAWVSASDGALKTIKTALFLPDSILPKISPDGRYIAYAARAVGPANPTSTPSNTEEGHIYVIGADGSGEAEVVKTAGGNRSPVWTPDGKHLLFLSDRTGRSGLWSIAIENGKAADSPRLVSENLGDGQIWPVGVTSSGSYHYLLEQIGLEQISIVDIDSAGRRVQGRTQRAENLVGIHPLWSPDGESLAFKRLRSGFDRSRGVGTTAFDLVVHSLETGEEKTFPTSLGDYDQNHLAWFHDGKSLLVGLVRNGASIGEYRLDLASGEFKQILEGRLVNLGAPTLLSPDDKTLYLFRGGVVAHDLATGKDTRVVSVPATGGTVSHRLSPDGSSWAFAIRDFQARKFCICTAAADGSNLHELYLPDFNLGFTDLTWTKDGRTILFAEPREEDQAKIAPAPRNARGFAWPLRIMRIPAQGGAPESTGIEVDGGVATDISPDGSRLALNSVQLVSELRSLDNVLSALK